MRDISIDLEVKKIGDAIEQAKTELKHLGTEAQGLGGKLRGATQATKEMDRGTATLGKRFLSLKTAIVAAGAALVTHIGVRAVQHWMELSRVQQKAELTLRQAMISMGRYAPEVEKQIHALAAALQKETIFGDEAILEGVKFLMTYKGISDDVMPKAIRVMADLAALMGGDMQQAANMVGKASMGMAGELRRVGITIDPVMAKSGDFSGILEQIENQVGGQAKALREAGGEWISLGNVIGDLKEYLGWVIEKGLKPAVDFLTEYVSDINKKLQDLKEQGDLREWALSMSKIVVGGFKVASKGVSIFVGVVKEAVALFGEMLGGMNQFAKEGAQALSWLAEKVGMKGVASDMQVLADTFGESKESWDKFAESARQQGKEIQKPFDGLTNMLDGLKKKINEAQISQEQMGPESEKSFGTMSVSIRSATGELTTLSGKVDDVILKFRQLRQEASIPVRTNVTVGSSSPAESGGNVIEVVKQTPIGGGGGGGTVEAIEQELAGRVQANRSSLVPSLKRALQGG